MEIFPPYAIFSLLALAVKCVMAYRHRRRLSSYSIWFQVLFVALFGLNIIELISFYYPRADETAYVLLVAYYVFALTTGAMLVCLSVSITGRSERWFISTTILLGAGVVCVLTPGVVLDGVHHLGYTITRIAGPQYWLFQVSFLSYLGTTALLLACGWLRSSDPAIRRKSKALLVALAPILLIGVTVVVLMHMHIRVTGTVLGSMAILFFLATLLATENEIVVPRNTGSTDRRLFRFLSSVPVTAEFRLANQVRRAVSHGDSYRLDRVVSNYERSLVEESLAICGGNRTAAAKLLGVSRTTLRRKLESQEAR